MKHLTAALLRQNPKTVNNNNDFFLTYKIEIGGLIEKDLLGIFYWRDYIKLIALCMNENKKKQAGAELCPAQNSLS